MVCCGTRISSTGWLCHTHQSKETPASVKVKKLGCLFKQSIIHPPNSYMPLTPNAVELDFTDKSHTAIVPKLFLFFLCSMTIIGRTRKIRLCQDVPSLDHVCGLS